MKKILSIALLCVACNHETGRQPWPDGKIPFVMVGVDEDHAVNILIAMTTWEIATNGAVEFFPYGARDCDNKPLYIMTPDGPGGISSTGYGDNGLNYAYMWANLTGIPLHELGHVLGLNHEHCRPDRDAYIKIKFEGSIPLLFSIQFIPIEPLLYDYRKYPFDYDSIMMYNSHPAEGVYIDAGGRKLGNETISIIDAMKVIDIYSLKNK